MNIDQILKKDENGKFILSEEEMLKELMVTPSFVIEFHFDKIRNYLSS